MITARKSIVAILIIALCCASIPVTASDLSKVEDTIIENTDTINQKISDELLEKMEEVAASGSKEERIPVCIWYEDIDDEAVAKEVERQTGLTISDLDTNLEMPSDEILNKFVEMSKNQKNIECVEEMEEYLNNTESAREYEKEIIDEFTSAKRKISKRRIQEKQKEIFNKNYISDENILFKSSYAPMIIAELESEEIQKLSRVSGIIFIEEYETIEKSEVVEPWNDMLSFKTINGFDDVMYKTGLTGDGVTMGMVDHDTPYNFVYEELDMDRIEILGATVQYWEGNEFPHSVNSAAIIMGTNGIAPNVEKLYVTTFADPSLTPGFSFYECMELLCDKGVKVINASICLNAVRDGRSYHQVEKWLDYIVNKYGLTILQSAGNGWSGGYPDTYRPVWVPGASYNVITVGGMDDKYTTEKSDDDVFYYNSYDTQGGCEKPDVLAPANVAGGGTSSAAPVVSGIVALMLELKPSLSLYPQAIKAILMASCHRKVLDQFVDEQLETMEQGLTEKQGAGVVDPYLALCIVGNGQYGVRSIDSEGSEINIVQPKYTATNMNVSLAWMQQNVVVEDEEFYMPSMPTDDVAAHDLALSVYENQTTLLASSNLEKSSTEMAYVPLNANINKYKLKIQGDSSKDAEVICAYAWSMNDMYYRTPTLTGIYRIKNYGGGLYLQVDSSGSIAQKNYHDTLEQEWIINNNIQNVMENEYVIMNDTYEGYVGEGYAISDSNVKTKMSNELAVVNIEGNDEYLYIYKKLENSGKIGFLQPFSQVSFVGRSFNWYSFEGNRMQMWLLEKINFCCGDVDKNGVLEQADADMIQQYIEGLILLSESQKYLADVNGDGNISIEDVNKVVNKITGTE